jgi:hypothetical protein
MGVAAFLFDTRFDTQKFDVFVTIFDRTPIFVAKIFNHFEVKIGINLTSFTPFFSGCFFILSLPEIIFKLYSDD